MICLIWLTNRYNIFSIVQVETQSKLESVYAAFAERIASGVWSIGSQIPTEIQLADEFKCSRSTIGKAISRLVHDGIVERRTRAGTRVLRSSISRGKAGAELDSFAFIYPSDQHEGVWRILKGFQGAASRQRRRVVTLSTGTDYEKETEYLGRLSEFDVRGAVIYPVVPSAKELNRLSQVLVSSKFPVVSAEFTLPSLGCPSVVVDGFHAGYTITRYLIEKGLKRIGFLANHSWALSMNERYRGYRWALEEAGLAFDDGVVLLEPSMQPDYEDPIRQSTELGRRYLEQARPEGVFCANDFLAQGLMRAAQEKKISVPEKLRVVGMDDFSLQSPGAVGLTTYHIPFEEIGAKSFAVLDGLLKEEKGFEIETRVRGSIVVRESA